MNTDKSSIEVKLFSGGAVINYEFRRTNKRLFGRNLEIKSFQLNEASSIDSAEKIEIFNTLKFEASKTGSLLMGLWFASYWQNDTAINRKTGWKRLLSKHNQTAFRFNDNGFIESNGKIFHWGDLKIGHVNFISFIDEISYFENGAIFICDKYIWPRFRMLCIEQINRSCMNSNSSLFHFEIVKFALSLQLPVIIATNWIENDIIDIDLFSSQPPTSQP